MKKNIFIACIILFISGSCTDELIQDNTVNQEEILSNNNSSQSDNLEAKYNMQSNPELMVADRIICVNSVFTLDLSLEESSELMIPKEIYEEALKQVEILNQKPNDN